LDLELGDGGDIFNQFEGRERGKVFDLEEWKE
jgi:hypothetical protein